MEERKEFGNRRRRLVFLLGDGHSFLSGHGRATTHRLCFSDRSVANSGEVMGVQKWWLL